MKNLLKQLIVLVSLLGLAQSFALHAGTVTVGGASLSVSPGNTRVVFNISGQVAYKLFTLDSPDRVVVDVRNARWQSGVDRSLKPGGYIRGLRSAKKGGDLRLVIDIDRKVSPKSFLLKPGASHGNRLVVDLHDKTSKSPARPARVVQQNNQGYRDVVIAIDAGHGGKDPGAIGRGGTREKHITLAVARKLQKKINRQPGMKAVLIRDGDYYLKLRQRIRKARQYRADLFVSLHADAFRNSRIKGSSVYILSERGASSEAAKWLAKRENAADELMGGVSLDDKGELLASVLLDLSQVATMEASAALAQNTLHELKGVGRIHKRRVERAGFAVLKSPDIPSILIELAFISNPAEEKKLNNSRHQEKLAKAITRGIERYFRKRPPDNTLFAARTHTIKRGDTLSTLAKRYRTTTRQLMMTNSLSSDILKIGQVLHIPSRGS